jgi:hypothetical protein
MMIMCRSACGEAAGVVWARFCGLGPHDGAGDCYFVRVTATAALRLAAFISARELTVKPPAMLPVFVKV